MVTCGSQYGAYLEGTLTWFKTYTEAARAEAEELRKKIDRKLANGGTVILTKDMWQQVEALRSGEHTPQSNGAN